MTDLSIVYFTDMAAIGSLSNVKCLRSRELGPWQKCWEFSLYHLVQKNLEANPATNPDPTSAYETAIFLLIRMGSNILSGNKGEDKVVPVL
jgi:hypothetical protein